MGFLLGFFLEAPIGMIGFWFLEVSSLLFVYMLFNFFFSGHMFPLDMLPDPFGRSSSCCRCSTWPTFRRPCFWARCTGSQLGRGAVGRSRLGRVSSSACCRFAYAPRRRAATAGLEADRHAAPTPYTARLPDVRPQQPGARHDLSREFLIETLSSMSWVLMNLGFYC